ncbi:acylphosphatase [Paracoccus kondratievae]
MTRAWCARCIEEGAPAGYDFADHGTGLRHPGARAGAGVGFRPFVWRLARAAGLRGDVLNDAEGVLIRLVAQDCGDFIAALRADGPPLARIDAIEAVPQVFAAMPEGFSIAASAGTGAETRVTPDAATCPECRAEIFAPGRRQGYAFTNCTHCGPRYTILRELPYDRARTTMAGFDLCPDCAAEYADPADRRFHAQPIACPACGPNLWYEAGEKRSRAIRSHWRWRR